MAASIQHADAVALLDALTRHILRREPPLRGYGAAARMIGRDGDERHVGQVTSRIDLAALYAGLPMITVHWVRKPDGQVNLASFSGPLWEPRRKGIILVSESHQWTADELAVVRKRLQELPDDAADMQWKLIETREYERPGYIDYNLHRRLRTDSGDKP